MRVQATVLALAVLAVGCARQDAIVPTNASATNTAEFPRFDAVPPAAARQLQEGEAKAAAARLEARGRAAAGQAPRPVSDATRLRRLRATHEAETIARIER